MQPHGFRVSISIICVHAASLRRVRGGASGKITRCMLPLLWRSPSGVSASFVATFSVQLLHAFIEREAATQGFGSELQMERTLRQSCQKNRRLNERGETSAKERPPPHRRGNLCGRRSMKFARGNTGRAQPNRPSPLGSRKTACGCEAAAAGEGKDFGGNAAQGAARSGKGGVGRETVEETLAGDAQSTEARAHGCSFARSLVATSA
jgi:hypothetical protein